MWSLFNRKEHPSEGIFDYSYEEAEELKPLVFSNKKSQADVVKEVLDEIEKGNKIIFIRGVCGTGKSAIALNLARHFKKTSIVVPLKSLQEQYEIDYTKKKFVLKKNGEKLKIAVIKGRNNFECPFLGGTADNPELPCTIELREKNMKKIKEYIEKNPYVSKFNFSSILDVRRISVAPACPYWSPLLPAEVHLKPLEKAKKIKYESICGEEFALFQRKKGCGYYDQYENYADADVLIFNSKKYMIETAIGRKPKTDLDIIDECDEFLDNFAEEKRINLNRLEMALSNLFPENRKDKEVIKEMISLVNQIISNPPTGINKLEKTEMLKLVKMILDNPYLAEEDETNYYNNVFEAVKNFANLINDTYVSFETSENNQKSLFSDAKKDKIVYVSLISINLAQRFKEIIDANNVLVLMSGTLHSKKVLRDIFGLKDFKIVEAEVKLPGTIIKYRTGLEKNYRYKNFKLGLVDRKSYLEALNVCIANAKPPVLVHVNAFEDLPSELEKAEFKLDNLISREKLKEMQKEDKNEENIEKFKRGEIDVLFTTKCARGVDFPGDKCNSIVLTKYPYPNTEGLFWKILKKKQPEKFFEFYMDKARREFIQKVMRGVRFKDDHVLLLSPDLQVLNAKLK